MMWLGYRHNVFCQFFISFFLWKDNQYFIEWHLCLENRSLGSWIYEISTKILNCHFSVSFFSIRAFSDTYISMTFGCIHNFSPWKSQIYEWKLSHYNSHVVIITWITNIHEYLFFAIFFHMFIFWCYILLYNALKQGEKYCFWKTGIMFTGECGRCKLFFNII